jgi:hypothetical protein
VTFKALRIYCIEHLANKNDYNGKIMDVVAVLAVIAKGLFGKAK